MNASKSLAGLADRSIADGPSDCSDVASPGPSVVAPKSAFFHYPSHLRLWLPALVILALDLFSKHWAFSAMRPEEVRMIFPGWLVFRRSLNPGALFGMGAGLSSVFIMASLVALIFVLYLFAQSSFLQRSLHAALGLILAGALGNLYDRSFVQADVLTLKTSAYRPVGLIVSGENPDIIDLGAYPEKSPVQKFHRNDVVEYKRQGVVRDFIKFEGRAFGRELWPWVFNVADSALVVGVCVLVLNFWFERRPRPVAASEQSAVRTATH